MKIMRTEVNTQDKTRFGSLKMIKTNGFRLPALIVDSAPNSKVFFQDRVESAEYILGDSPIAKRVSKKVEDLKKHVLDKETLKKIKKSLLVLFSNNDFAVKTDGFKDLIKKGTPSYNPKTAALEFHFNPKSECQVTLTREQIAKFGLPQP